MKTASKNPTLTDQDSYEIYDEILQMIKDGDVSTGDVVQVNDDFSLTVRQHASPAVMYNINIWFDTTRQNARKHLVESVNRSFTGTD